ncbi:methyltransferase domain-containing protein [Nitrosopumilus sp. S4]
MLESTLEFIRCARCGGNLDLEVLSHDIEIDEGILECKKCKLKFPIIDKIPILWDDFSDYLSSRKILGGKLYQTIHNKKLKSFLRSSLLKKSQNDDRTALEERWSKIYQNSKNSKFYSVMKKNLKPHSKTNLVLEYGCSIGIITSHLADSCNFVLGIDRSFSALQYAKKSQKNNLDYIIADSLSPVFGFTKFDLIIALNVLELIEPTEFLKHISKQISNGALLISDPYDFDRGTNSVKKPLDEHTLRTKMLELGFNISQKTKTPSFIPWKLKLNPRATLDYKVDFVLGQKIVS